MKTAIIGGGPSGIFCAIKLLELLPECEITIFEKAKPLLTLLPTGNGRCNLSYNETNYRNFASNYPRGEKFLYSVFSRYSVNDTIYDFEKIGIDTYIQEDERIFPITNKSSVVREKLLLKIKNKVKFVQKNVLSPITGFDAVILATGLKNGAKLAEKYRHTIIPVKSSLVGLKIAQKEYLELEGTSINGIIFTKFGVSGPYIYKLSSINAYKEFPYEIEIPLLDVNMLADAVMKSPKKLFRNVVSEFIPKKLANILVKVDKQCANTSKKEIEALKTLSLTATGIDNQGEITFAGGVSLKEINKNMKSKIAPNLWIIGELLDVDGFCGGFNLQNCWSTASIAAFDIASNFAP